jgi:putative Mg2+ transporter-C (MgtC) family protein
VVFRQDLGRVQQVRGLTTAAALFAAVTIGAAAGEGRLLLATVATAIALLVLELRYIRGLMLLDGRRWASRFRDDELPPQPLAGAGNGPHPEADDK